MEKIKDLAEEYALARLQGRLSGNEVSFCEHFIFTEGDIETAFNDGRESVVEKASELEWKEIGLYEDCGIYLDVCKANKPLDEFLIRKWSAPKDIELLSNKFSKGGFKTIEEAKSYATKVYKERIKEVLGL